MLDRARVRARLARLGSRSARARPGAPASRQPDGRGLSTVLVAVALGAGGAGWSTPSRPCCSSPPLHLWLLLASRRAAPAPAAPALARPARPGRAAARLIVLFYAPRAGPRRRRGGLERVCCCHGRWPSARPRCPLERRARLRGRARCCSALVRRAPPAAPSDRPSRSTSRSAARCPTPARGPSAAPSRRCAARRRAPSGARSRPAPPARRAVEQDQPRRALGEHLADPGDRGPRRARQRAPAPLAPLGGGAETAARSPRPPPPRAAGIDPPSRGHLRHAVAERQRPRVDLELDAAARGRCGRRRSARPSDTSIIAWTPSARACGPPQSRSGAPAPAAASGRRWASSGPGPPSPRARPRRQPSAPVTPTRSPGRAPDAVRAAPGASAQPTP